MVDSSVKLPPYPVTGIRVGLFCDEPFGELSFVKKEIRILELHPADSVEPLTGTLHRTSTLNPCSYEALSWSWGSDQSDGDGQAALIVLNSRRVQIRARLAAALRTLRRVGVSRHLWVDAICIRQAHTYDSLQEKSEQIQLMAEIFQSAEKVLVWIDPELRLLARFLPSLEELADPMISREEALNVIRAAQEPPWAKPGVLYDSQIGECTALHWLIWLSQFPYWRRVWVVQEVALAKRAIIVCAREYLDFDHVVKAYERMRRLEVELFDLDHNIAAGLAIIEQSIGLFRDCREQAARGRSPARKELNVPASCTHFGNILSMCRGQLSTDPRDKIYGLLGLGSEAIRNMVAPRYTISALTLSLELVQLLVQETKGLFPLSQAISYWSEDDSAPHSSGPSWLPCWTAQKKVLIEYEQAKYRLQQQSLFRACGEHKADLVKFQAHELVTKGVIIDCICSTETYSRWQEGCYLGIPNLNFLMSWLIQFSTEYSSKDEQAPLGEDMLHRLWIPKTSHHPLQGEDAEKIFWETWSHGQEPDGHPQEIRRCDDNFAGRCRDWRQQYTRWARNGRIISSWQGPGPNVFGNDLWGSTDITLYDSRLFFTQDGFLGLTGRPTLPGDKICVLAGGHLPFILRPLAHNPNQLRLVSECFLSGIMDGEATENHEWSYQWRRCPEPNRPQTGTDVKWEEIVLV